MKTTAAGTPHRLTSLLALANLAALVCVAYLLRADLRGAARWETRRVLAIKLSSDASFLAAAQSRSDSPLRNGAADDAATYGLGGVAAELPAILRRSGVDSSNLLSVIPEPPRPIANTDLLNFHVRVSMEDLSLEQLARISHALTGPASGRSVEGLLVRTPRSRNSEHWDAELILTSVGYSASAK